jgi:hypothetical protein
MGFAIPAGSIVAWRRSPNMPWPGARAAGSAAEGAGGFVAHMADVRARAGRRLILVTCGYG